MSMAAVLRTPSLFVSSPAAATRAAHAQAPRSLTYPLSRQKPSCALKPKQASAVESPLRFPRFRLFTAYGDLTEAEQKDETPEKEHSGEEVSSDDETTDAEINDAEETVASTVMLSLQAYKDALVNRDQSKVAEIESILLSIDAERNTLSSKVASLLEELSTEKDRVIRISADFDNFRKRTERERLSLMTNVQGEVIESLLPVLDSFERAKSQIKVESEEEEKINNSYQSIYKQFMEILASLGVESVKTVGCPFDPLLHEAIVQEESSEYEEGIIIQEFRKGFRLGERLLRPSMVKVSAGPGPEKGGDGVVAASDNGEESENIEDDEDSE
ncbi:protein GrpE-like [Zingiber officinale]|uniref:GrpE protein homolog n=1 Tax=Zingiber officinale TaxID=94328 RepID=A0A8J5HIB6_ZINOF|nr:protein GrpE-like [Zingiber officinale]KAG6525162.1 hypothetical protein ZIOFF_015114 [Zingiber officinale]